MRPLLSLKLLIRTPFKTLLTFLLLAAASFALFTRAAEYTIVTREMNRAAGFYRGILALDTGVQNTGEASTYNMFTEYHSQPPNTIYSPPPALTAEQIETFELMPQVSSVDRRYMTSGVSLDGIPRFTLANDWTPNYANTRFIAEGRFFPHHDAPQIPEHEVWMFFRYLNILSADPQLEVVPRLRLISWAKDGLINLWDEAGFGDEYGFAPLIFYNNYGKSFVDSLVEDSRYIIVGRYVPKRGFSDLIGWLGDETTNDFWPSVVSMEGLPENYLETEEFAALRLLIEMTENDRHTFDIVYTSDMLSIPRFAEQKMVIEQGRVLTAEDEGTANCIINDIVAKMYSLKPGDTITMALGGKLFQQNYAIGAVAAVPERYAPPVETVELTIVGTYLDTDAAEDQRQFIDWSYSQSTIFVPSTLLPVEVPADHEFFPGELSFIIENGREGAAFMRVAEPLAEEMGIELRYSDGGWLLIEESLDMIRQMSIITIILFLFAAAAALVLAVWLFIGRSKKQYAVMRAMGATSRLSQGTLLLPFCMIVLPALPLGAYFGLNLTTESVTPILNAIAESVPGYMPDASISSFYTVIFLICIMLFLLITAVLFLLSMGKTSPLALLQGETGNRKAAKKRRHQKQYASSSSSDIQIFTIDHSIMLSAPKGGNYPALMQIMRSIFRHIRRTVWKTILSLILTLLFCGAMCVLIFTRLTYEDLLETFEIKGFLTYAASDAVEDSLRSELIKNVFYRDASYQGDALGSGMLINDTKECELVITNNVERFLTDAKIEIFEITYADDYEGSLVEYQIGIKPCMIGGELARVLDISIGDSVHIYHADEYEDILQYMDELYPRRNENEMSMLNYTSLLSERLGNITGRFTVVGIVECEEYSLSIFAPVGQMSLRALKNARPYLMSFHAVNYFEFTVADRERVDEALEFADRLWTRSIRLSQDSQYTINTAELDNMLDVLELVDVLFPFAVAAAVLIGVLAPVLLLLQATKETAIMRSLGTTCLRARNILALEQIFLCILGMLLTAGALAIYDLDLFLRSSQTLLFCGGLYLSGYVLASVVTSAIVTRKNVMQLLQVKE